MPEMRHYDCLSAARLVTSCRYRRHQLLALPAVIHVLLETLQMIRTQYVVGLFRYVIIPEHEHLVLHPPGSEEAHTGGGPPTGNPCIE